MVRPRSVFENDPRTVCAPKASPVCKEIRFLCCGDSIRLRPRRGVTRGPLLQYTNRRKHQKASEKTVGVGLIMSHHQFHFVTGIVMIHENGEPVK